MTCACGCGLETSGYWRGRQFIPAVWVRGHNRRGAPNPARDAARDAYHDLSCVPTEPLRRLLAERMLEDLLHVPRGDAHVLMGSERIRRATAELILRRLAGMPRPPTLRESDIRRRQIQAERRRKHRASA